MGSQELSQDSILKVLSQATVETICRCRLLCKEYNQLTYESYFHKLHCQKTNSVSGYVLQSLKHNKNLSSFVPIETNQNLGLKLSLDFLPCSFPRIEACDPNTGIMLCVNYRPPKGRSPLFMVCKPTTKQWWYIPKPKTRFCTVSIGISVVRSKPLRYKIIRLSQAEPHMTCKHGLCCLCYEVFDSDVWCWRILDNVRLPDREFLRCKPAVFACGSLHWLTTENNVLSFRIETEDWCLFPHPKEISNASEGFPKFVELVKYEGKVGVIHVEEDWSSFELWVLQDFVKKSWVLKQKMNIKSLREKTECVLPLMFSSSDVATLKGFYKLFLYNLKTGSIESVKIEEDRVHEIFQFCSNMDEVDLSGKYNQRMTLSSRHAAEFRKD